MSSLTSSRPSPINIQKIWWDSLNRIQRRNTLRRPSQLRDSEVRKKVSLILEDVKTKKDRALQALTYEYDGVLLSSIQVAPHEIQKAYEKLDPSVLAAIKDAINRITTFHQAQIPKPIVVQTASGIRCERRYLPISTVGFYIPGGTASLPSTVMMLGVPALLAGCQTRILVTPPRKDHSVDEAILVTADLLGITQIYKAGGAQAIAALAYGTQTIPKVDKIFGPGNSWVTEAKLQVSIESDGAVCDLPAGPSEVMVIADKDANPAFIAADLLSQAEHGIDSQVIFVTDCEPLIEKVLLELKRQVDFLPRREIALESLAHSLLIQVSSLTDAFQISNDYAPEHLIVQATNPAQYTHLIRNAGSVFLGPWTPESLGDYASGTNHVLPTCGFAKAMSGLGTESFMKSISFQEATMEGLLEIGPTVVALAEYEKLIAHGNAVQIRLAAQKGVETDEPTFDQLVLSEGALSPESSGSQKSQDSFEFTMDSTRVLKTLIRENRP